jgi:hypothetical protein
LFDVFTEKTSPPWKINCYIKAMSKSTVKSDRRPAKAARRTVKKIEKTAQAEAKKTSKSARREVGSGNRGLRAINVRSPSVAPKDAPKILRTSSPPVQPMAADEVVVKAHKYHVGESVYFTSPTFGRAAATGSYTVVKLLPSEGDDYQYRIKSSGEAFERVAKESQLDRV